MIHEIHSADAKGSCPHRGIYVNLHDRVQYTRGREKATTSPPELRTVGDPRASRLRPPLCLLHLSSPPSRPRSKRDPAAPCISTRHLTDLPVRFAVRLWRRARVDSRCELGHQLRAAAPLVSWLLLRTCGFLTFP
jgi:hypothetical protein